MKIAFIVGKFPVLSETFVLNQIIGLISRGHEVDIYGYQPDDTFKVHPDVEKYHLLARTHYPPEIPRNYLLRFLKGLQLVLTNFPKAPLVLLRSLNFFKYGGRATCLRLLYSVIRLLKAQPYDIIHCQFGTFAQEGLILRDIGAIQGKLITTFRGYDISQVVHQRGEDVYDSLFAKGDFFLANCEYFKKRAIKLGCDEKKIVVHGSGIDSSRFPFKLRNPHPDGKIRITTTGRLIEKKGIEYSIRAVAKVSRIHQNIEYNIIGDGYLKESLQQLIEELNIADKVHLLGWKNQPEIIEILDNSDIFMAPSVTATNGDQDAPVNTLKEAMLMTLPVIATRHGGIPELVQDGISGFLVPERDADAIAEKLSYLIEHPEIWSQMGQAGRTYVESNYDINKLNDELIQIYRQILSNDLHSQDLALVAST
ncbi:colanic acid biosynthesis glycosyltransferase WcaL [Komarekiella sp. 'clone 1']|uniref:Colanic acid biosynthesis glycosyltransferase WcaL n=1 Tax=Komarekiella delphini-convector SJRDD-AB1 TaxID=2593771 RepID=A0AA40SZ24_9NOST|nr:glycosyltransferase [Komarekiella delphini-convector]MBD6617958.1 colanic acid biosynthesis glycosyltransferase WcaL [Komarekiella delphini-convector SJRDD-AB1]